LPKLK